jgi:hypothetical protein
MPARNEIVPTVRVCPDGKRSTWPKYWVKGWTELATIDDPWAAGPSIPRIISKKPTVKAHTPLITESIEAIAIASPLVVDSETALARLSATSASSLQYRFSPNRTVQSLHVPYPQ